ncbi:hypothetical protein AgCh_033581 [Apium graveolens]
MSLKKNSQPNNGSAGDPSMSELIEISGHSFPADLIPFELRIRRYFRSRPKIQFKVLDQVPRMSRNQTEYEYRLSSSDGRSNYHASIRMPPYEAFYGRKCRSPLLEAAQDTQRKNADLHRKDMNFEVGSLVLLKPGKVAYEIALPPQLQHIHNVFHVSMLKPYIPDSNQAIEYAPIELQPDLSYVEQPIQILDRKERVFRNKSIPIVKMPRRPVRPWQNRVLAPSRPGSSEYFVLKEKMFEVDCPCLTPEVVLKASGHVEKFTDLMVDELYENGEKTGKCYPADHLLKDHIEDKLKTDANLTAEKEAEFRPDIAKLDDLSPEQIGTCDQKLLKISPRQDLLRVREFRLAEIEHFVDPEDRSHPKFPEVASLEFLMFPREDQMCQKSARRIVLGEVVDQATL